MTEKEFLETSQRQKRKICSMHSFETCEIMTYRKIDVSGVIQYVDEPDGIFSVTKIATGDYIVKNNGSGKEFVMKLEYKAGKIQAVKI